MHSKVIMGLAVETEILAPEDKKEEAQLILKAFPVRKTTWNLKEMKIMIPIDSAAVEIFAAANNTIALTGAGISVASGIPHFRGCGGIWENYDPEEYGTIQAFQRNPAKVWSALKIFCDIIDKARPNPAHFALASLERLGYLRTIITQNIDGLHQEAGSSNVIEFHGNNRWLVCQKCGGRYPIKEVAIDLLPPLCACGGVLKPDVVLFGEMIPHDALYRSYLEANNCSVVIVIGTSAAVEPAASIPRIASKTGAKIIEINPEEEMSSDIHLSGCAEEILPILLEKINRLSLQDTLQPRQPSLLQSP
ncbi:MAG: NAD-dependent deacetylase 2 [Desulfotomaculum sp. 46_80]|nr:MAG: NAD-dependent deacetylase 2 [Desulfotomaculum sp. 46_80]